MGDAEMTDVQEPTDRKFAKGWSGFIELQNQELEPQLIENQDFENETVQTDDTKGWSDFIEIENQEQIPLQKNNILEIEDQEDDEFEYRPELTGLDDLKESTDGMDPLPSLVHNPNNGHSLEGFLIVWGCGEFGQHGHGHHSDVPISSGIVNPLLVGQDSQVTHVACGSSHTLVVTGDSRLFSWGNSNSGQLGIGVSETTLQPHLVPLGVMPGTRIQGVACGTRHSFVWTEEGECFSFGNNYSAQLGYDFRKPDFKENQPKPIYVDTLFNRKVLQVACGSRHSLFLFSTGHMAAVGCNNRGQIGLGNKIDAYCIQNVPDVQDVTSVACGNSHCLAADGQGNVYAWGYSKACGLREDVLSPLRIFTSHGHCVKALAGGDSHSMILLTNGQLFTCGNNYEGQLGQGSDVKFVSSPTEVQHPSIQGKVMAISVGENTSAASTDEGKLFLWGQNSSHVVREDEGVRHFQCEPHPVCLGDWKAHRVSCGSWHVACIVSGSHIKPPTKDWAPSLTPTLKPEKPVTPPGASQDATAHDNDVSDDLTDGVGNDVTYDVTGDVEDAFMDYPLEETVVDLSGNVLGEAPCTCRGSAVESVLEMRPRSVPREGRSPRTKIQSKKHKDIETPSDVEIKGISPEPPTSIETDTNEALDVGKYLLIESKPGISSAFEADNLREEKSAESRTLCSDEKESKIDSLVAQTELETVSTNTGSQIDQAEESAPKVKECESQSVVPPLEEKSPIKNAVSKTEIPKSKTESAVKKDTKVANSTKDLTPRQLNKAFGSVTIGFPEDNKRVERPMSKQAPSRSRSTSALHERSSARTSIGFTKVRSSTLAEDVQDNFSALVKQLDRSPQISRSQRDQVTRQTCASPSPPRGVSTASWSPSAKAKVRPHPPWEAGQLYREKKPVRSLRKIPTQDDMTYCLPNQPMDITGDTMWTRPHPPRRPITRTRSHPNMYGPSNAPTPNTYVPSNVPMTPPSPAAKMRSVSTTSPQATSRKVHPLGPSTLPPRPPRSQRRSVHNPVFSSGSSWRTRDSDLL